jgi:translation initiation factor IF-1
MFTWSDVSSGSTALESLLPKDIPEGWTLVDRPQTYTKKTLFKHIDGQAELFFKYGFQKSIFAIYQNKKESQDQIELDIYDMGNVIQAFGIFSRFRGEERIMGIGLDSYLDDQSALFYKGKYFVMLYSTESNPAVLKQFSMAVSLKVTDNLTPPKEISYFPPKGLQPGSIQYFPEGLLGYQFLKRGFKGTYVGKTQVKVEVEVEDKDKVKVKAEVEGKVKAKVEVEDKDKVKVEAEVEVENKDKLKPEGKEFHLFLAIFKNSQGAMSALKAYRDDLSKKGKMDRKGFTLFKSNSLKGEDPYHGKVIVLQKGFYLVGVVGFEKEEYAKNLLAEFMRNIR